MDDPYWVMFLAEEARDIRDLTAGCLDVGLATTPDGRTDVCAKYRVTDADGAKRSTDFENRESIIEQLSEAQSGALSFWKDKYTEIRVSFSHESGYGWNEPTVMVHVETKPLDPNSELHPEEHTRKKIQERVETVIDVIANLAEISQPEFVYGHFRRGPNPTAGVKPTGRPIKDHIDRLPWITVLSESVIEEFGGRKRVLDTPAWRVKELETGHVLIVKTNHPFDPTEGPSTSTDEYLLEGNARKEAQPTENEVTDPFTKLEDGTLAADVIIRRDNVDGELTNDDLELVRCEVRDNALWELDSGAFLRRTIDAQGNTIGDLPEGVSPAEEPYPPLIRLDVPPAFVQLESPNDENIVTKVMTIDADVNKLNLLANLAGAVSGENDLEAIEPLVDQLSELDDVDGIERVIEQRIL